MIVPIILEEILSIRQELNKYAFKVLTVKVFFFFLPPDIRPQT
jgi:hypothetical protein